MTTTLRETRNPVLRPAPPPEHNLWAQSAPADQLEQCVRLRTALLQALAPFPQASASIIRAFEPLLPPELTPQGQLNAGSL